MYLSLNPLHVSPRATAGMKIQFSQFADLGRSLVIWKSHYCQLCDPNTDVLFDTLTFQLEFQS